ncbi:hypothetical protein ACHHYP_16990 [Achlya hypogyna]|uniref:B30.2/SPRY domain-containing protein n=1 Tax=Achlya hypogyna TaxID=1202772 RepID=A0A1V9Y5F4_ACHHY|nr:hypothetical protein ACHHYP_16990 [Achlya hypogyna]
MEHLPREVLVHALSYLDALELRAVAVVSKAFAAVPTAALWEQLFRAEWNRLNSFVDTSEPLELSPALLRAWPRRQDCYRWLTHVVAPVPSFADIEHTNVLANLSAKHRIEPVAYDHDKETRVTTMALGHDSVGGDRSVRANAPFQLGARVQLTKQSSGAWLVDVVENGYFEVTLDTAPTTPVSTSTLMCVAVGLATRDFHVVGQQPGWDTNSFGYHSDDGRYFANGQSNPFATGFDVGDTVGCGLERRGGASFVYFTRNGQPLGDSVACLHDVMYPVVGLDAAYTIKLNCGSEPFKYSPPSQVDGQALEMLQRRRWPQMEVGHKPQMAPTLRWLLLLLVGLFTLLNIM